MAATLLEPRRLSTGGDRLDGLQVEIVRDSAALERWWSYWPEDTPLAIDTETTGLDVRASDFRCRLVQLSDGERTAICDLEAEPSLWRCFAELMRVNSDSSATLLGWNVPYDASVLYRHDPDAPIMYDLGLVWDVDKIQREVEPRTNLKGDGRFPRYLTLPGDLASAAGRWGMPSVAEADRVMFDVVLSEPDFWGERTSTDRKANRTQRGEIYRTASLDDERWVRYAAMDPAAVVRLWQSYTARMDARAMLSAVVSREVSEIMFRSLYEHGMAVDDVRLASYRATLDDEIGASLAVLKDHGCAGSASSQVRSAMGRLGAVSPKRTDRGGDSWDKEALLQVAERTDAAGDLARAVNVHRNRTKMRATHINPMTAGAGRVYPQYRIPGTLTGRWSVSNPPVQQAPVDGPIRGLLRARPGYSLIASDYDQLEIRLAAVICHARSLRDPLLAGTDMHMEVACRVWGEEQAHGFSEAAGMPYRYIAKRGFFGWMYGAGTGTLTSTLGIGQAEASRLIAALDAQHPNVRAASNALDKQAEVHTLLGRRIVLLDRWRAADGSSMYPRSRKALSWTIQGSAADVLNLAVCRWWRHDQRHPDSRVWLGLHDEMIVEVPDSEAQSQLAVLTDAMEFDLYSVPFTCSDAAVLGTHWDRD